MTKFLVFNKIILLQRECALILMKTKTGSKIGKTINGQKKIYFTNKFLTKIYN